VSFSGLGSGHHHCLRRRSGHCRGGRRTGHDLPGGSSCPCIEVIDDFVGEHAGLVGSEQESFSMERVDGWRTKTRAPSRKRPIVLVLG
jgi:hypothetical protein